MKNKNKTTTAKKLVKEYFTLLEKIEKEANEICDNYTYCQEGCPFDALPKCPFL